MADPFPTPEGVDQAFQRVKELRDLHVLVQPRLAALCADAARAGVSSEAEYKALRDEIIHLNPSLQSGFRSFGGNGGWFGHCLP